VDAHGRELEHPVEQAVGVTVAVEVLRPAALERSIG
jgi:hypothetical protein